MLEGIVSGIISGVLTPLLLGVGLWLWRFRNTELVEIEMVPPEGMRMADLRWGVNHALDDDGKIVNRVHWLKATNNG